MNHEVYRELISGRTGGLAAAFVRCPLNLISWLYYPAVAIRNCLYSKGWLKTYAANAVVISIGNITVGGTGKTPLAIWLYRLLRLRNVPCAILTRGYKATQNSKLKTQNYIDEPALLANACPEAGLIVNPDRVAAAGEAVQQLGAKAAARCQSAYYGRRLPASPITARPGYRDN
ncbi:MAG: tetraacyldisaccharide 4'-kinase [Planctomycetota bacterium]